MKNKGRIKIKGLVLIIGFLNLILVPVVAQELDPVTWTMGVSEIDKSQFEISFGAEIEEGWHLYSVVSTEGQDVMGPVPTEITFEEMPQVRLLDEIGEKGERIEKIDTQFDMLLYFFENEVTFIQRIGVRQGAAVAVRGEISFMLCNDEQCIFPEPLSFEIEVNN